MVQREFNNRTSLIVDPADGRIPALTAEAQQRRAALAARDRAPAGPEDLNNNTRCITSGVPRIGGVGADPQYGYYQIVQAPGYVTMLMETFHDARIYSTGRATASAAVHPPMDMKGMSIRWRRFLQALVPMKGAANHQPIAGMIGADFPRENDHVSSLEVGRECDHRKCGDLCAWCVAVRAGDGAS